MILCYLYLCDQKYVNLVFDIIKNKTDNENFIAFLDNFEKQYMIKCSLLIGIIIIIQFIARIIPVNLIIVKLNRIFNSKPSFFRLLYELRNEKKDIKNTFKKRKIGLFENEIRRTNVIEKKLNLHESILNINKLPENNIKKKKLNLGLKV